MSRSTNTTQEKAAPPGKSSSRVPHGYKQTEVGVIPEDWDTTTIAGVASIKTGPFGTLLKAAEYSKTGGVPLISVGEVRQGFFRITEETPRVCTAVTRRLPQYLLDEGDIVFGRKGGVDRSAVIKADQKGWFLGSDGLAIRPNGKMCSTFLGAQFQTSRVKDWLLQNAIGTTMPSLNQGILGGVAICLPPTLAEQEAIATALSDADALIDSLEQLIAKKRLLKQGAMQDLLTGKKRLPGFEGEWVVRQIGEIGHVGRGRVISHIEIARAIQPLYPVFSSQTSNSGVMGYLDAFDFEGDYITWTTDGANAGTVFARSGKFNCTNVCGTIRLHNGDHRFIASALGMISKAHVSRHLGNPKLMNDIMKRIEIRIPRDISEQTAIAAILSDMDAELAALEAKLSKARQLKQGMMQELLTGKTRLI